MKRCVEIKQVNVRTEFCLFYSIIKCASFSYENIDEVAFIYMVFHCLGSPSNSMTA